MKVIAHRGSSGTTPENTRLSVATAVNASTDLVEIDLQLTKDKQIILFHDRDFKRITGEDTNVQENTLKELQRKDVGKFFHEGYSGQQIPTLMDILSEFPSVDFILEIKPQKQDRSRELETKLLEILDELNYRTESGYISVRDFETYDWFKSNTNKYRIGVMGKNREPLRLIELINENNTEITQIRWELFDVETITVLNENVEEIYCSPSSGKNNTDFPQNWDILLNWPINGILTNFPNELKTYYYYWLRDHSETRVT